MRITLTPVGRKARLDLETRVLFMAHAFLLSTQRPYGPRVMTRPYSVPIHATRITTHMADGDEEGCQPILWPIEKHTATELFLVAIWAHRKATRCFLVFGRLDASLRLHALHRSGWAMTVIIPTAL